MISSRTLFTSVLMFVSVAVYVGAFQIQPASTRFETSIAAHKDDNYAGLSRRNMLKGAAVTMSALLGGSTVASQPAEASYSAYTNREKDWEERQSKGGE
jgi:heme A synthase